MIWHVKTMHLFACIFSDMMYVQYIALKFQHFFDYFSFFNFRGIVMTFHDISTVFLHNRLENQVLDTYGGHLKVQKAIQKTSKDLMFFSVQMLCSWFCRRDMGHRHLCYWFCRLGNLQNHEQKKKPCKKNVSHGYFHFFANKWWKLNANLDFHR